MEPLENVLFMLSTKEEKCLQINFSKDYGYTKIKVTDDDLYLV